MANTYILIASNTLGSSAASVTFSSIPNTYTDLVLKISARTNRGANAWDAMYLQFNSTAGTAYSTTRLNADGASALSDRSSSTDMISTYRILDASTATANTFSNIEIYIPSYTVSQNKPLALVGTQENNNTTAYLSTQAGLWSNTAAISSVLIGSTNSASFVSGSSFFLYGVKNS